MAAQEGAPLLAAQRRLSPLAKSAVGLTLAERRLIDVLESSGREKRDSSKFDCRSGCTRSANVERHRGFALSTKGQPLERSAQIVALF